MLLKIFYNLVIILSEILPEMIGIPPSMRARDFSREGNYGILHREEYLPHGGGKEER